MWEEEPVGVDPKRPLVGFALVAVLCAVLMTLSVGRGWSMDLVHPGKPLVAPAAGPVGGPPSQAPVPSEPMELSIPDELTTQPLGVAHGGPVTKKASAHATPEGEVAVTAVPEATRSGKDARSAEKAQRRTDQKSDRKSSDRIAAKAQRQAEKTATKALRTLQKAAEKAERHAEKAAEKAERQAEKAVTQALRDAEKAARKG
jgi:hypothetical protein